MERQIHVIIDKKFHNEIQGPHVFFYTLLVMFGNYEPTCIVTIKITSLTTVAKSFFFVINQILLVTSNN